MVSRNLLYRAAREEVVVWLGVEKDAGWGCAADGLSSRVRDMLATYEWCHDRPSQTAEEGIIRMAMTTLFSTRRAISRAAARRNSASALVSCQTTAPGPIVNETSVASHIPACTQPLHHYISFFISFSSSPSQYHSNPCSNLAVMVLDVVSRHPTTYRPHLHH